MRSGSMAARTVGAALAATALVAAGVCVGAPAASAQTPAAAVAAASLKDALVGDWQGPFAGYENNWHRKGFERLVITEVHGQNAIGTWQFKDKASDPWSKKQPLRLVALPAPSGGWIVTGADRNGTYDGTLNANGTKLDLAYQSPGDRMMAYYFALRKQ